MSTWILLMVLLDPVAGINSTTLLNTFSAPGAYTDCLVERDRISADMRQAYPGDTTFSIECRERVVDDPATAALEVVLKAFAATQYPSQTLNIRLSSAKTLQNEGGALAIVAIQLTITHKDGTNSFILLVKEMRILGWIPVGPVDPVDEEETEIFSAKDQA